MSRNTLGREYKKRLRQKLFYYLDIVGLDNLDLEQREEFGRIVLELGIRRNFKLDAKEKTFPFQFEFESFTVDEYQRLLDFGYTIGEIQKMCGVSEVTFYYWRKKEGLLKYERKDVEMKWYIFIKGMINLLSRLFHIFLQGIEVNVCRKSQITREMIKAFYKTFPFLIDEFFALKILY